MSKAREFAALAIDEAFKTKGVTHEELDAATQIAGQIRDAFDAAVAELKPSEGAKAIAKRILRRAIKDRDGIIPKGCKFAVLLGIQYDTALSALDATEPPGSDSGPIGEETKEAAAIIE